MPENNVDMKVDLSELRGYKLPDRRMNRREVKVVFDFLRGAASGLWWDKGAKPHTNHDAQPRSASVCRAGEMQPERAILLPGFGSKSTFMFAVKRVLQRQGFEVFDWGLGLNDGDVPRLMAAFISRLLEYLGRGVGPVTLVGWSLGGYIAREAARDCPQAVKHIVTLGTPVVGGPRYTMAHQFYRRRGWDLDEVERLTAERFNTPLQTEVTAIYSKLDGVVSWQACIDRWSPRVEHHEVGCTHLGLALAPEVLKIVGQSVRARR